MYDQILVPTDGSDAARAAAEEAIALAEQFGGTVHAVYVVDESATNLLLNVASLESVTEAMSTAGSEATERIAEMCAAADVPVETEIIRGMQVHGAILEYIETHEIDLVVMGTAGRRGVQHLLGSTTERVLANSSVPVLSVAIDQTVNESSSESTTTESDSGSNDDE